MFEIRVAVNLEFCDSKIRMKGKHLQKQKVCIIIKYALSLSMHYHKESTR